MGGISQPVPWLCGSCSSRVQGLQCGWMSQQLSFCWPQAAAYSSSNGLRGNTLMAVTLGQYKAHFWTWTNSIFPSVAQLSLVTSSLECLCESTVLSMHTLRSDKWTGVPGWNLVHFFLPVM